MSDYKCCPKCGENFVGEDIYEFFLKQNNENGGCEYPTTLAQILDEAKLYPRLYDPLPDELPQMSQNELDAWNYARSYGWTKENSETFSIVILGIEISGSYDGMEFWHCTKCKYTWKRFKWSNLNLLKEQSWAKDYNYEL